MLISALAAVVLFAAPETTQSGEAAKVAAEAGKPEMKRVCTTIEVSGSNLPKKRCKNVPVKAAEKPGQEPADKAQTKPE